MTLEFKTPRNKYGSRRYLLIDTDARTYSTFCPHMIVPGIEVKTADYKTLIATLEKSGYREGATK